MVGVVRERVRSCSETRSCYSMWGCECWNSKGVAGLSFAVSGVVVRAWDGDAPEVSEIMRGMVELC